MIGAIAYLERKRFLQRGAAPILLVLLILALSYAGWSGKQWVNAQSQGLETFRTEQLAALEAWRAELVSAEQGEPASAYAANPLNISFPATLDPSSLGDFAVGHADLHPASGQVSPRKNPSNVFGIYQFDNPVPLAVGSFDVMLVVIVLIPMLMIAISFDVLARDRQQGSLGMILAAPVSIASLAWSRLLLRNGLLLACAVLAMAVLLVINDGGGDRYARFGLWLAVTVGYWTFWLALIGFCVARLTTATQTVAVLAGLWILFTLAIPGAVATATEAAYPTPSRLAFLSEVRDAQGETNRELADMTDRFLADHPDLTVGDEGLPSYFRATFLSNKAAMERTQPILQAYETARADRASALKWAQFLSPSIIAQKSLSLAAGADLGRQHAFQSQVDEALEQLADRLGPAVVSRNRITLTEFDNLAPFVFQDQSFATLAWKTLMPVLLLLVLSIILFGMAQRRFRQLATRS